MNDNCENDRLHTMKVTAAWASILFRNQMMTYKRKFLLRCPK